MCKFFPEIKLLQKQDFELGKKELLRISHVKRVVLGRKVGVSSEELSDENYDRCHLYIRKILINRCYLGDKESSSVEIEVKPLRDKDISF